MKLQVGGHGTLAIRAAAVVVCQGHVLLHRSSGEEFWCLMGGGVEFTETSADAVVREVREELGAECRVERLLWIVESFFGPSSNRWHEVGFYYLVSIKDPAFLPGNTLTPSGAESDLRFHWFPIELIPDLTIYPVFLRTAMLNLPKSAEHIVNNEPISA